MSNLVFHINMIISMLCLIVLLTYRSQAAINQSAAAKSLQNLLKKTGQACLPAKYKQIISKTLGDRKTVICESYATTITTGKNSNNALQLIATDKGKQDCAEECKRRSFVMVTNLNELVTNGVLKGNRLFKIGQPEDDIVAKFRPNIQYRCVQRKDDDRNFVDRMRTMRSRNQMEQQLMACDCPTRVAMFGSKSTKIVVDRLIAKVTGMSDDDDDDEDIDIEALRKELDKLEAVGEKCEIDDASTSSSIGRTSTNDDAISGHGLQRRTPSTSHDPYAEIVTEAPPPLPRLRHASPQTGSWWSKDKNKNKETMRIVHTMLLVGLIMVAVLLLHLPPMWILVVVVVLIYLIVK